MRRKAFTLLEILATIPLLVVAGLITAKLYILLLVDIPVSFKAAQTHDHIAVAVNAIREDIQKAESFYIEPHKLEIQTAMGQKVTYAIKEDKIIRTDKNEMKWNIPYGLVEFSKRSSNSIKLDTAVEYKISGKLKKPQGNCHLIFTNAKEVLK